MLQRHSSVTFVPGLALLALSLGLAGCHPAERAARKIAAKNADARGGLTAWRAVESLSMSGRIDAGVPRDPVKLAMAALHNRNARARRTEAQRAMAGGAAPVAANPVQLPFVLELKRPHKSRLELRFGGDTAVQVFDGKAGWKLRPFLGRREVEPFTPEELRQAAQQTALDGPLIDFAANAKKLELAGTEPVEGHDAFKIKVTTREGEIRNIWVDTRTHLEVMIDGTRRLDGKPRPVWTHYRDYRSVGGLMIPHLIETMVDSVPGSEKIVIENVVVNPALADSRFGALSPNELASAGAPVAGPAPAKAPAGEAAPAPKDGQPAAPSIAANGAIDSRAAAVEKAPRMKRATRTTASYHLPDVGLVRADGKAVTLQSEMDDGRLVVLNFVFTTCQSICPVMSQVFSQLQDRLGADRAKVHMMSISIDPEQDTPARLAEYARKFHAGAQWGHYTGTTEASIAVQRAFDTFRGDKMGHTPATFLRAGPGKQWVRVDGFASSDELASQVRELLAGG